MASKIILDKEWLIKEHFNNKRGIPELAKELNVSYATVKKNIESFGYTICKYKNYNTVLTEKYLQKNYIELCRSAEDLGQEIGVHADTIRRYLNKYNIPVRDDRAGPYSKFLTKEYLIKEYVNNKKTVSDIAEELNIPNGTKSIISRALRKYGIYHKNRPKRLRDSKNYKGWKGCGELSGTFYLRNKISAENRNMEFNVSIEYLWNLYLLQDKKCALSGIEIHFAYVEGEGDRGTASLDRIDSSKGYTEDNVQWVHKDVNRMKNNLKQDDFIDFCIKIASKAKFKNK